MSNKGEAYEGVAFTFCKAATIILLTGRWALPAAALACSAFYIAAYVHGQRATRCILGPPLVVAAFWTAVASISVYLKLRHGQ